MDQEIHDFLIFSGLRTGLNQRRTPEEFSTTNRIEEGTAVRSDLFIADTMTIYHA